jgi:hypothetical protein
MINEGNIMMKNCGLTEGDFSLTGTEHATEPNSLSS